MEVKNSSRERHCLAASDIPISPGLPHHTPAGGLREALRPWPQSCRVGTRNGIISAQGPQDDRDQSPT